MWPNPQFVKKSVMENFIFCAMIRGLRYQFGIGVFSVYLQNITKW